MADRRTPRIASRRLLPSIAVFAAVASLSAQEPQDVPARTFGETVDVRVVNVDVVVLDAEGNRVTGLTREDFAVFEDGRPMEITNFAAYDEAAQAAVVEGESAELAGETPEGTSADLRRPPPATWVVYVDSSRLEPGPRNLVLREARQFLQASLRPGDRAMATAFDGLSLKLLSPLSADPAPVLAALEKHEKSGAAAPIQTRARANRIQNALAVFNFRARAADAELAGIQWELDSMLEEETLRAEAAIGAFEDLLAVLGGIDGRVGLLFGAAGFEANPIENLYQAFEARAELLRSVGGNQPRNTPAARAHDVRVQRVRREYMRLLTSINASRVTVYSVFAGEGRFPDVATADVGGAPDVSGPSLTVGATLEGASTLTAFATETGGRPFVAATDLSDRLKVARADFATYYSLGYRPVRLDTGKLHDVRVDVARAGLRVIHRKGVSERTAEEDAGNAALTALLGEGVTHNELNIDVEVGQAEEGKRRGLLVPVAVRVPLRGATLMPSADGHHASFGFHFSIRDPDGGFRRLEPRELEFDVPAEKLTSAMNDFVTYRFQLALKPGRYELGVAALDRIGGTRGAATAAIDVAKRR